MTGQAGRAGTGDRGRSMLATKFVAGHEHLAGGLIHMNGRIYDPVLGRFLSADIVVQAPGHIVSYNRYAYVMNNPLAYTDPSGYFIAEIIAIYTAIAASYGTMAMIAAIAFDVSVIGGAIAMATGHTTAARRFFAAAINIATAGTPYAIMGAMAAGGLQSGSVEGAFYGALQAGFSFGVGELAGELAGTAGLGDFAQLFAQDGIGRAGLHAVSGCFLASMQGGKCGPAAASAGFSEFAGGLLPKDDFWLRYVGKIVVGGTVSVIAGGNFGNGAMTAALTFLFNEWQHTKLCGREGAFDKRDTRL